MMRVEFVFIAMLAVGAMAGTATSSRAQTVGTVGTNKAPVKEAIGTHAVEGCLKPSTPGKFRIDNAKLLRGAASGTAKTFQTYQITPVGDVAKDVKLDAHVGHKVELGGSVIEGSSSDPPRFFMTEFKMLSRTCP